VTIVFGFQYAMSIVSWHVDCYLQTVNNVDIVTTFCYENVKATCLFVYKNL